MKIRDSSKGVIAHFDIHDTSTHQWMDRQEKVGLEEHGKGYQPKTPHTTCSTTKDTPCSAKLDVQTQMNSTSL